MMISKVLKLGDETHKYWYLNYIIGYLKLNKSHAVFRPQSTELVTDVTVLSDSYAILYVANNNNETTAHMFRRKISSSFTQPLITVESSLT